MTIPYKDIQSLSPGALIEVFSVDATALGGSVYNFHAGTNDVSSDIVWQGVTYTAFPIEATGFEITTKGTLPRPRLVVSNVGLVVGLLVRDLDGLVGAVVTRKRTFAQYLDGAVGADPTKHYDDDIYLIERKVSENRAQIVFELVSPLDAHGLMLPGRLIQATVCVWNNSAICVYSVGGLCNKTIDNCKTLWGATAQLPFGGFPGSSRIR